MLEVCAGCMVVSARFGLSTGDALRLLTDGGLGGERTKATSGDHESDVTGGVAMNSFTALMAGNGSTVSEGL